MLKYLFVLYLLISSIFTFYCLETKLHSHSIKNLVYNRQLREQNIISNFPLYCMENNEFSNINNQINYENKIDEINETLNNMCCGEVNEKSEIKEYEQLEKELFLILQKIRKHSFNKIYEKSKKLYELTRKKSD